MVIRERTFLIGSAAAIGLIVVAAAALRVRNALQARPTPSVAASSATGERIETISTGETVDLLAHLPDRGRTVVEFTAEW